MVLACRRRRVLRIVAFIGAACVIFLCFQLFLVGFLDHDAHLGLQRGAEPKLGIDTDELRVIDMPDSRTWTAEHVLQPQQARDSECSSLNCSFPDKLWNGMVRVISKSNILLNTTRLPSNFFLNDSHKHSNTDISEFESVWEFLEHRFYQPVILERDVSARSIRGVNRRWQYLYEADAHMRFTCILSQVNLQVL